MKFETVKEIANEIGVTTDDVEEGISSGYLFTDDRSYEIYYDEREGLYVVNN